MSSLEDYPKGDDPGEDRVADGNLIMENCPFCQGTKVTETGKKCEGCNGYGTVYILRLPTELRSKGSFSLWQCNPLRYWT